MPLVYRCAGYVECRDLLIAGGSSDLPTAGRNRKGHLQTTKNRGASAPLRTSIRLIEKIMNRAIYGLPGDEFAGPRRLDVVIEIPRGSFLKRGSTGRIDFVSPLPCPFNYGSVPQYLGLEGDLLDAVVLGPRLPAGKHVLIRAWGAVVFTDRGMTDDKLICSHAPLRQIDRDRVLRFFRFYARCKGLLNRWRRYPGSNRCEGWITAEKALARARLRDADWHGPSVPF